jgi:predicted RNase H-like HicB family nuclease
MRLRIQIHLMEDGRYRASCPSLPGCTAEADDPDAVLEAMEQSIDAYIASLDVPAPARICLEPMAQQVGLIERTEGS